jgi:PPOX class probable F420-dependent enzyme
MPRPPVTPEIAEFLARPNPAAMATLRPDGSPHTAATWYVWEDGRVHVNMDRSRKRLANVRNDPRVSLTVLGQDDWYHQVSLRGRVVAIHDDPEFRAPTGCRATTPASRTPGATSTASACGSRSSRGTAGPQAGRGPDPTEPAVQRETR